MSTNRIIELCLVFLISVLSFSIGTYVGKKYSDNQHKLALLDPNYDKSHVTTETEHVAENTKSTAASVSTDVAAHDTAVSPTINDADVAKMAAEFSQDDASEASVAVTEKEDNSNLIKTIEEDGTPVVETKKTVAKTVPSESKAKDIKREVAHVAEKVKAITEDGKNAKYTIQVGSFPTAQEAEKVVSSLQARGYKVSQTEAHVNGKNWHRVQVGLFANLEQAQAYKKELMEQSKLSTAIITRTSE